MKMLIIGAFIIIGLYFIDKICLWAEEHGYLFYRRKKSQGSALGSALLELQGFLNPSARHTIEMKQNAVKHIRREADVPGDLKK